MKASDNNFPSVLVAEGATPTSPSAGSQRMFLGTDHKFKRVNSAGTVTDIEGAPAASAYSLPSTQQAGTAYTLVVADRGTVIEFTSASAVTLTIPAAATADLGADAVVNGYQAGAGQVTVIAGSGVTLRAPDGAKSAKQYGEFSLRRRGTTDEWVLSGNVTT